MRTGIFRRETCRILELTKASEYLALSDTNKEWYKLILSVGLVDLQDGSLAKEKLWDMFDEDSNTGKNFRDPANGLLPLSLVEEE